MNNTMMITGINGQDGCYLAKIALENGYDVIGVQRKSTNNTSKDVVRPFYELGIYKNINFQITELEILKNVEMLIKTFKPKYFVHFASQSSIEKSFKFKDLTYQSNTVISKNIIDSIEKYSRETIMFFPSSATIFEGYENTIVDENTNPLPLSNYSISKFNTQNYIDYKINQSDLTLKTGILFSHESEFRRYNFFSKKITKFLVEYQNNNNLCITVGDLSIKRDIGYAPEYAEAIFKILLLNNSEKFVISSNILYKLSDFVENCLNYLGTSFEIVAENNMMSFVNRMTGKVFIKSDLDNFREYDLRGIQGNNSKLKKLIDWEPKLNLNQISQKMIDYELKINNK